MVSIILSKPRIIIKEVFTIGFNPSRSVWQIEISNKCLHRWQEVLLWRRKNLEDCWIEADFVVGDEIPSIADNKMACAIWGDDNYIILKSTSTPYKIELISKIYGEDGFHIKKPVPETSLVAEDSLVCVLVKTGEDEIVTRAIWAVYDKGAKEDLEFERLE